MSTIISQQQWFEFDEKGYVKLGKVVDDSVIDALKQRIDDIMRGRADLNYDKITMQEDSDPDDYGTHKPHTSGHKGAHLNYRKIQKLEFDPLFLQYIQLPVFAEACRHVYGPATCISAFRAMFFNKPARRGTFLGWHQDAWTFLSQAPLLTAWTALDASTIANGCVKIIEGSHKFGHINQQARSGFLTYEQIQQYCPDEKTVHLMLGAGEVVLLHNWLLHSSDRNRTDRPRRAFSLCYMDAATKCTDRDQTFTQVFGPGALSREQLEAVSTGL